MKEPTVSQIKTTLKVLAWFGTVHNMAARTTEADEYAKAITIVKADAKRTFLKTPKQSELDAFFSE